MCIRVYCLGLTCPEGCIYMMLLCARYELAESDSVIVTLKRQVLQVNFIEQTLSLSSL